MLKERLMAPHYMLVSAATQLCYIVVLHSFFTMFVVFWKIKLLAKYLTPSIPCCHVLTLKIVTIACCKEAEKLKKSQSYLW